MLTVMLPLSDRWFLLLYAVILLTCPVSIGWLYYVLYWKKRYTWKPHFENDDSDVYIWGVSPLVTSLSWVGVNVYLLSRVLSTRTLVVTFLLGQLIIPAVAAHGWGLVEAATNAVRKPRDALRCTRPPHTPLYQLRRVAQRSVRFIRPHWRS